MKKVFLFLSVLFGLNTLLYAVPRSAESAQLLAVQHFTEHRSAPSWKQYAPMANPVLVYTQYTSSEGNTPALYVFNNTTDGFVIVSADDCTKDVIAYSDHGTFDPAHIPSNLQHMLSMYAREIASARANGLVRKPARTAATYTAVSPLCTAKWGQDSPFNNQCPMDGSERAVSGCVATAAAQVMYANKHPQKGTGSHSYTWNGKTLTANFGNTTYQWSNMLDSYAGYATSTQKTAVATLMYHCGVACEMEYSADGSGAYTEDMATGLTSYFGYDKGIKVLRKDYLTEDQMLTAISADLQAGHTILIDGATTNREGHAFVCDGMDTQGYLHINWGWDGYCDGYYQVSALEPADQGIGGASSGLPFTEGVSAFTNIKPDAGGEETVTMTAEKVTMTSASTISKTTLATFRLDTVMNHGLYSTNATIAFLLYDSLLANYGSATTMVSASMDPYYYYYFRNASIDLSALPDGNYYLSLAVTQDNILTPIYVYASGETLFPFCVSGNSITFSSPIPMPASGTTQDTDPEPEPLSPSLDFTYLTVYDYQSKGYDHNLDIMFTTADYSQSGDAQSGTALYLGTLAKSMTSLIGTYVINDAEQIGSIWSTELTYGDGTTKKEVELRSGYLTISSDTEGNYLISFDFYDTEGNNYLLTNHTIASGNTLAGTFDVEKNKWVAYDLQNEQVSGALSATTALAMIARINSTNQSLHDFFVEGIVSTLVNTPSEMAYYGSCRLYISDDGTTENQLYGYNLHWLNDAKFDSINNQLIHLQDTITVFGRLQNYNGNTPEVKGYIYQHIPYENSTTQLSAPAADQSLIRKFLQNGEVYIRRDKKTYHVSGKTR